MFRTITARYPGICRRCNGPITVGQQIRFGGKSMTYHLAAECNQQTPPTPPAGWTSIDTSTPQQPDAPPVMTPQLAADIRATFTSLLDRPAQLADIAAERQEPEPQPADADDEDAPDWASFGGHGIIATQAVATTQVPKPRNTSDDRKRTRKAPRRLVNPIAAVAAIADPF